MEKKRNKRARENFLKKVFPRAPFPKRLEKFTDQIFGGGVLPEHSGMPRGAPAKSFIIRFYSQQIIRRHAEDARNVHQYR